MKPDSEQINEKDDSEASMLLPGSDGAIGVDLLMELKGRELLGKVLETLASKDENVANRLRAILAEAAEVGPLLPGSDGESKVKPIHLLTKLKGQSLLCRVLDYVPEVQNIRSLTQSSKALRSAVHCEVRCLDLGFCKVTDAGLERMAASCTNLDTIDLQNCTGVTDSGVSKIARRCRGLRLINLTWCDVTDASLSEIAAGCKILQHIDLSYCEKVTDAGLVDIAKLCPLLEEISLRRCDEVTDAGLIKIARGCHHLKLINLKCCSRITDRALEEISLNCPKLQELNLSGCEQLTDSGLRAIAKRCRRLKAINLCGCFRATTFTDAGQLRKRLQVQQVLRSRGVVVID